MCVWCKGNLQLPYLSFLFNNNKYQGRDRADIKHLQHDVKCFWQFTVCRRSTSSLLVERRFFSLYSLGWFNKTGKKNLQFFISAVIGWKDQAHSQFAKKQNCLYWGGILFVAVVPLIPHSPHNIWCFPDTKTTMTNLILETSGVSTPSKCK